MKTVSIGDTHGITVVDFVLQIINDHDKFIFMGDYVDSFNIDDATIQKNLYDLIELKKTYPDKVVLLWGNHDIQYLLGYDKHGCSGYRPQMLYTLFDMFSKNKDLFQLAYQIGDTIWSHAGIHEGWYKFRFNTFVKDHPELTLSEQLNLAFKQYIGCIFDVGHIRGGQYRIGGPLWCDISELKSSPIREYNQIIGHSATKYIQKINKHNKEIVFIDVLQSKIPIDTTLFYYKNITDETN